MLLFSKEFLLFLFYGGLAALVNFSIRFIYDDFMSFGLAVIFSYVTAMLVAFILMRYLVFNRSKKTIKKEFSIFVLVNFIAIGLTWTVSVGLAEKFFPSIGFDWFKYEIAHLFGILVPAMSSYFGHKYLTFR